MALKPFSLKSRVVGDSTVVEISGSIDENAKFVEVPQVKTVLIQFKKVELLNSSGVRNWCLWIQRFHAPIDVVLVECPNIVVKSFNSVRGFLTDRCQVQSFYVPHISDETGERQDVLLTRGQHFGVDGEIHIPEARGSKGEKLEPDVIPETYFKFLKQD